MLERVQAREIRTFAPTIRVSTFSPVVMLNIRAVCTHCGGTGFAPVKADPAVLVNAVADNRDRKPFTGGELFKLAEDDDALCAALKGLNPRKLGKLLASIEGKDFDGISVIRIVDERSGLLWALYSRV